MQTPKRTRRSSRTPAIGAGRRRDKGTATKGAGGAMGTGPTRTGGRPRSPAPSSRGWLHVPPAPAPPPAPRAAAMVLRGPGFSLAPPSQMGGRRAGRGRGTCGGGRASGGVGPGLGRGRARQRVRAAAALLLRRKKTTNYRNMAADSPAAAVHAGMMAAGRRR